MSLYREQQQFPTRNYPYRAVVEADEVMEADAAVFLPNTLYRHVLGVDTDARPMTGEDLAGLEDPFGRLLRSGKPFPLTLRQTLASVDALTGTPEELPRQLVFLVADGGHVPWSPETATLERAFRFAVARGSGDFSVLISSSTAIDREDNNAFLQVIGWDAAHAVFHYYQRLDGTFFWAGMSPHALEKGSRGKGPFDSHVNGSLVMKELRSPWIHWHAPLAGINPEAFEPGDPLIAEPIFQNRSTAERLEIEIVRPGVRKWNEARVQNVLKAVAAGQPWRNIHHFLRQAVTDTTVNLITSETASRLVTDNMEFRLPITFFLNTDTLFGTLELEPEDLGEGISIPGRIYRDCILRYDVHRTDGRLRLEGDSHFAWMTPEPAFEDTHLVEEMTRGGLLTDRFVAGITMIDFTNPVFSPCRASLLTYVPREAEGADVAADLENRFVKAIEEAVAADPEKRFAGRPDSPEQQFLAFWNAADWRAESTDRIAEYLRRLETNRQDAGIVDGWFRLAEHRRRRFRKRPLAEFSLTTPRTNIPLDAAPLAMTPDGIVVPLDERNA